jgi:hypothetical protein
MDLNSIAIGAAIISLASADSSAPKHLIDRYKVETTEGVQFVLQADQCNLYYDNSTLGCYKNREWVLIAPWNKIKHFKQLEEGE